MTSSQTPPEEPKTYELSFPLPLAPETKVHLRLIIGSVLIQLFLTTVYGTDGPPPAALGSYVYALPDRNRPGDTLATSLYIQDETIENTTRMARLLAKKTGKPVYVGNSMSFASAGMGGTVEEQLAGFRKVIGVVMHKVNEAGGVQVNGTAHS